MNKYGIEHFHIELVEECSIEQLSEREQYWIEYYKSYHDGYNATVGGDGKFYLDYEKIYQVYQETLNCKKTAEIVGCCADSVHDILHNIYHISPEVLQRNGKLSGQKKVAMLDKNTFEVLEVFASAKEAGQFLGKSHQHIHDVCNGKRNSAYGYDWCYTED